MQYQTFSKDTTHYDLGQGYSLVQADAATDDFVHHWASYRPNEGYHQDWTNRYSDLKDVPFCYWITKEDVALAGCLMLPNTIAELFLIPPHEQYEDILSQIIPLLKHWSDTEKPIQAMYILPEQIEVLKQKNFIVSEQRRWMIRPSSSYQVQFRSDYCLSQPKLEHLDVITDLFIKAFSGGTGEYGRRDKDQHKQSIQKYFDSHPLLDASAILHDTQSGKIVSVCLVSEMAGHSTIQFVATHPQYQRCGIGKKIIQYAVNALYGIYPWVTLAVTIGNPAENLYRKLGFQANIAISTMTHS